MGLETSLNELVEDMMRSDLKLMQKDLDLLNLGINPIIFLND